jgi:hypothetical protein
MVHDTTARSTRRRLVGVLLALVAVAGVWSEGRWFKGREASPGMSIVAPAPRGQTTAQTLAGVAAATGPVVTRADWDFAGGVPPGWTSALPDVRLAATRNALEVRTTFGVSEYQLQENPIAVGAGSYSVELTAAIRYGGLAVGVLDVTTNEWLATGVYASSQRTATRTIVLPFTLPSKESLRIILSNWMPGRGRSRWSIVGVRLKSGFAIASPQAHANAAAFPAIASASFGAAPPERSPLAANVANVMPAAIAAMHGPGTTWAKATQIRTLVREAMPRAATCDQLAVAYWQVGARAGLTIRLVLGMANGTNLYDSHETTSVWLPEEQRWVISDATFNGFWSGGPKPVPIGVEALRNYLIAGREDEIYWHQTHSRNAIRPSSYYVDPLALYRYPSVQARVRGEGVFLAWDPAFATFGVYQMPATDIDKIPPGAPVTVTKVPSRPGSTATFPMPPAYLERRVVEKRLVVVGSSGIGRVTLGRPGVAAVTAAAQTGNWVLGQLNGKQFPLTPIGGAELSPIVTLTRTTTVRVIGAAPGTYVVQVWTTKRFPKARELDS